MTAWVHAGDPGGVRDCGKRRLLVTPDLTEKGLRCSLDLQLKVPEAYLPQRLGPASFAGDLTRLGRLRYGACGPSLTTRRWVPAWPGAHIFALRVLRFAAVMNEQD